MLTCAVTGQEPREPVVSPYGHLFERSVILDWLRAKNTCPITNQPLSADQLVALNVPSRPLMPTIIPDLLSSFQGELNRLLEERWKSEAVLRETREQLAVALYRVDAATRVVARLTRERDDLLQRLAASTSAPAALASPEISRSLPSEVAAATENLAQQLQAGRKEAAKTRKSEAPTREQAENFCEISDSPVLHAHGGISVLRLQGRDVVATAGRDLHIHVLRLNESEISQSEILASLRGQGASLTSLAFHPLLEILYAVDEEGTLAAWSGSEQISSISIQDTPIEISLHPSGSFMLVATASYVRLLALNEHGMIGNCIGEYRGLDGPVTAASFHPDGLLMGICVEISPEISNILIFDLRSGEEFAQLSGHQSAICDFRFGENGYTLVSTDVSGRVLIWDLRKSAIVADLPIGNLNGKISAAIDNSCQYVAVAGGQNFRLFAFSGKTEITEICSFETRQEISDILWLPGRRGVLLGGSSGRISLVASR